MVVEEKEIEELKDLEKIKGVKELDEIEDPEEIKINYDKFPSLKNVIVE